MLAIRSLHQSYKVPVENLLNADWEESARKRDAFMKKHADVKKRFLENNPELQKKLGIFLKD